MARVDESVLESELRSLVSGVVEMEPSQIRLDSRFVEDLGMDSMMALEILAAIEKKYKIQIPEEKLRRLTNLKEAIGLTSEHLSGA
jgi:acyl carrier protein